MENRTTIQISEDMRKELRMLAASRDINYQELLKDMISVFKELDGDKTIISIPKKITQKINEKLKETDMKSSSEYITFVLRLVLSEKCNISGNKKITLIKQRLKSLGYGDY